MMTKEELNFNCEDMDFDDLMETMTCIKQSHIEALAEIEFRKKESVLKNGLINQYKDAVEKLKAEVERLNKSLSDNLRVGMMIC